MLYAWICFATEIFSTDDVAWRYVILYQPLVAWLRSHNPTIQWRMKCNFYDICWFICRYCRSAFTILWLFIHRVELKENVFICACYFAEYYQLMGLIQRRLSLFIRVIKSGNSLTRATSTVILKEGLSHIGEKWTYLFAKYLNKDLGILLGLPRFLL